MIVLLAITQLLICLNPDQQDHSEGMQSCDGVVCHFTESLLDNLEDVELQESATVYGAYLASLKIVRREDEVTEEEERQTEDRSSTLDKGWNSVLVPEEVACFIEARYRKRLSSPSWSDVREVEAAFNMVIQIAD